MTHETVYLKEENKAITLKTYISGDEPEICAKPRPAVIVIPGGGYVFKSIDSDTREGNKVARTLQQNGLNAFVLLPVRVPVLFDALQQQPDRFLRHLLKRLYHQNKLWISQI